MGRPRKFVQDKSGRTIAGVSYHKRSGYYIINPETTRREYFGHGPENLQRAWDRHSGLTQPRWMRLEKEMLREVDRSVIIQRLLDKMESQPVGRRLRKSAESLVRGLVGNMHENVDDPQLYHLRPPKADVEDREFKRLAAAAGMPLPNGLGSRWLPKDERPAAPTATIPPAKHTLRDCFKVWRACKEISGCRRGHIAAVERHFCEFMASIGDRPISSLTADYFVEWQNSVAQRCRKHGYSNQWQNDRHKHVKGVFRLAKRKRPSWSWPSGLLEWCDGYDRHPHQPHRRNREPMPIEEFQKLLRAAESWATRSADEYDTLTQTGRAKRNQAKRKRREGVQLMAMLHIAINCGFLQADCARIKWENVRDFEGTTPHIDFSRGKTEGKVGSAVDRLIPLLPQTVHYLRKWRDFESPKQSAFVFRSVHGGPFAENSITNALGRLAKAAALQNGWSFKHIRNIGPTLGKRAKRPKDERDAFLGHVVSGTSRFYEGDIDHTFLIPLVNLIGEHYLDGNTISTPTD